MWLTISDVRTSDLTTGANNWATRFPYAAEVKPDGPGLFRASRIDAMQNKLFGKYYPSEIYGTLDTVGPAVEADSAYDALGAGGGDAAGRRRSAVHTTPLVLACLSLLRASRARLARARAAFESPFEPFLPCRSVRSARARHMVRLLWQRRSSVRL